MAQSPSADTSMTWAAPTDHHHFEKAQLAQWAREDEFDRLEADFVDYFIRCGVTGEKFDKAIEFKSWLTLEELRAHFVEWSPNADRTKNHLKKVDRNRYVIRFE